MNEKPQEDGWYMEWRVDVEAWCVTEKALTSWHVCNIFSMSN